MGGWPEGQREAGVRAGIAAAGTVVAACLAATMVAESTSGLLQRAGLTVGDIWLVAAGVCILRGSSRAHPARQPTGPAPSI